MKNVRTPTFIEGLYRDLRDRRLLLPALALVVGLLAVPVLLTSNSSSATTSPAPDSSPDSASAAAAPAVVTQQLGVTQYRKRLNELNSKNPFHQQYTTPPKAAQLHVTSTGTGSTTTGTGSSTTITGVGGSSTSTSFSTSTTPSTSSTTPVTGGTPSTSSPSVSSTPPSSGGSGQPPATQHTKPTFHLYTYRVALKVGEPGKLFDRPEVSSLALLPSKSRPILSFLQANGKHALFLVSTDIDSVKGDGRCVPKPNDCQYILMRAGDKASFHYAPSNKRFNLILTDIHAVEIGHKPPAKVSGGNVDLKPKLPLLGQG
jgi:hypothetical protein